MSESPSNLVADVLQGCAAVAPRPWNPADFARGRSESADAISYCIEALCRADVLKEVFAEDGQLQGHVLSPRGNELVSDPQAIARFCEAERLDFSGEDTLQRRTIRQTFLSPARPRVTRLLLVLNIGVFVIGFVLASRKGAGGDFFLPTTQAALRNPAVKDALEKTGKLDREHVLRGAWWRLLSCGFVHFSIIHLLLNMYFLRALGASSEWLWGSWRYLVLYLLSLVGGSCAAMTKASSAVGASGGLCGLMGAMGVWVILNRQYLPRRVVRQQMRGLLLNALLISALSLLLKNVSGAGHLGGAVVGVVAALLLHWHRFGGSLARGLALLGLIAVPIGCVAGLDYVSRHDPAWRSKPPLSPKEERELLISLDAKLRAVLIDVQAFEKDPLQPLAEMLPRRRDREDVGTALKGLAKLLERCREVLESSSTMKAFSIEPYEEVREAMVAFLRLRIAYMERMRRCLENRKAWEPGEKEVDEINSARSRWKAALKNVSR